MTGGRPRPVRRRLASAGALLGLACLPAAAAADQGIRGLVTLGPTCAAQRVGERCTRPFATTLTLRRIGAGGPAQTVRSAADGRFRVALRPGRYRLTPLSRGPLPRAEPQTVVVRFGRYTRVDVAYDTGIR